MKVNLKKSEKIIKDYFDSRNFEIKFEIEENQVEGKFELTLDKACDNILGLITYTADQQLFMAFIFDNIEKSYEVLELLDNYNEEALFLKANLLDNALSLELSLPVVPNDSLTENIDNAFYEITSDLMYPIIVKLCEHIDKVENK